MTRRRPSLLRAHRRASAIAFVALALSSAGNAFGDEAVDLARARGLYDQGVTREAASDWSGALAAFEQVAHLRLTPQVRFHVARCKEKLGRLNEALGGYRLAEYDAEHAAEGSAELLGEIRSARSELEERIPKLVIVRGEGADAIKIELDGVALGQPQLGVAVNVDPGPHVIVGVLPSGERFEHKVTAEESHSERVVLDVPAKLRPTGNAATGSAAPSGEPTPDFTRRPKHAATTSDGSAWPWLIGGAGVVSFALAGYFYTQRNQAKSDLDDVCIGSKCPDTVQATQDRGQRYATLTNVALGVGVIGIGVATVLLLTRGGSEPKHAAVRAPRFQITSAGTEVSVVGRF